MSERTYKLVFGIVTGVEAIAEAVVTFIAPSQMVAINAAIPVVGGAIIAVCKLFMKSENE